MRSTEITGGGGGQFTMTVTGRLQLSPVGLAFVSVCWPAASLEATTWAWFTTEGHAAGAAETVIVAVPKPAPRAALSLAASPPTEHVRMLPATKLHGPLAPAPPTCHVALVI